MKCFLLYVDTRFAAFNKYTTIEVTTEVKYKKVRD